MSSTLRDLTEKAVVRKAITAKDGQMLWQIGRERPFELMAAASGIREHFKGKNIILCGIVNAKSGACSEDCKFCAQSAHYFTNAPVYPLFASDEITEAARVAGREGAHLFGIVTSGTEVSTDEEWATIADAVRRIKETGVRPCASLGMLSKERVKQLKDAGLYRYHHNLETARSFFPNVCTTHEYDEDIATVRLAREAGLSTCCGGIIGLGETMEQRIELAFTVKELDVDSVPINVLNPIPGTPLAGTSRLTPLEILCTIAIFRFILPDKDIKLCGGKEANLRQLLPLSIIAGCNSLMTGNYLTTPGRETSLDLEMIADLGLCPSIE
jgi:biotin synthase